LAETDAHLLDRQDRSPVEDRGNTARQTVKLDQRAVKLDQRAVKTARQMVRGDPDRRATGRFTAAEEPRLRMVK
jgi:hypothetical protein